MQPQNIRIEQIQQKFHLILGIKDSAQIKRLKLVQGIVKLLII